MDPSPLELAAFSTVADIAVWIRLPGDMGDASTPLGSWTEHLGLSPDALPRELATVPPDVISKAAED